MRKGLILIIPLALITLTGCTNRYKAKVESNTKWSGYFDNRTVDGTGNATVDIGEGDIKCVAVQKMTELGYLNVSIIHETTFGESELNKTGTSAAYGLVSTCNK